MFRLMMASAIAIALCGCASTRAPEPEYVPPSPPPPAYVPPPPPAPVPPAWRGPPTDMAPPPAFIGGSTRPTRPPRPAYSAPERVPETRVGYAPMAGSPPPAEPAPGCERSDLDCNEAVFGRGSFAKPPEMWVGKPANLKFAVARTDEGVGRELAPSDQPAGAVRVSIGRCMKVTLDEDSRYDILGRNGVMTRLARDMDRASWTWSVLPKQAGLTEFRAKVEVLRIDGGRCRATAEPIDEYTERVEVQVRIGMGGKIKGAVGEATETGGLFANLFKSWEGALAALAALLAALAGVIVAVRNLGPKGRERRATKKAERAARPPRRKAKP